MHPLTMVASIVSRSDVVVRCEISGDVEQTSFTRIRSCSGVQELSRARTQIEAIALRASGESPRGREQVARPSRRLLRISSESLGRIGAVESWNIRGPCS